MDEHLLTLNAGSSSVKFALFALDGVRAVYSGQIDGIGLGASARLKVRGVGGDITSDAASDTTITSASAAIDHDEAIAGVLGWLREREVRVAAVGHRIVHGGVRFVQPLRIDDDAVAQMAELIPLAPLHQPHNVAGVKAARRAFAHVPQVACFDTAFHAAQPELNTTKTCRCLTGKTFSPTATAPITIMTR